MVGDGKAFLDTSVLLYAHDGTRQFVVVDAGGNHIRIGQPIGERAVPRAGDAGRRERSLEAAVTLADSKGVPEVAELEDELRIAAAPSGPARGLSTSGGSVVRASRRDGTRP